LTVCVPVDAVVVPFDVPDMVVPEFVGARPAPDVPDERVDVLLAGATATGAAATGAAAAARSAAEIESTVAVGVAVRARESTGGASDLAHAPAASAAAAIKANVFFMAFP
jgi:hypothetical protein